MTSIVTKLSFCTAILLGAMQAAAAQSEPQTLFNPPAGFWLRPFNSSGPLYGEIDKSIANWQIQQEDIPQDLSDFTNPGGQEQLTNNGWAEVVFNPTPATFSLQQWGVNGTSTLSCTVQSGPNSGNANEYDLLAVPNTRGNTSIGPAGVPIAQTDAENNLGQLQQITNSVQIEIKSAALIAGATPCAPPNGVSQLSFGTSLIFTNKSHGQTFFYQIHIARAKYSSSGGLTWGLNSPRWVSCNSPTGYFLYDDNVATYGQSAATIGVPATYNLSVEGNVTTLLAAGSAMCGMDANPGDWVLSGAYIGGAIWGPMHIYSIWSDYGLTTTSN